MGVWNFYFFLKFYLYFRGFIRLDFILNLLFLVFLMIPVPKQIRFYRAIRVSKNIFSIVAAILLLWHDSWLPPFSKILSFVSEGGLPSKEYIFRFLAGYVNPNEILALVLLLGFCYWVYRKQIRLTPVVVVLLLIVPLQDFNRSKEDMNKILDSFLYSESKRVIRFSKPQNDRADIDIVILHVCSLSWDDLREAGLEKDPFFNQFDYLFTRFNSVTSYSGPSAIRLLRGTCGQVRHESLYQNAGEDCYLFDRFKYLGYTTYTVLNHDGLYGHFDQEIQKLGHLDSPILSDGLPVQAYNFDGSKIYDDYTVLERWWQMRLSSKSIKSAVYYNTISLHDGAHLVGVKEWWKQDRKAQYRLSVLKLFSDFTKFIQLTEFSGKKGIILFVPEHGMALKGNRIQAAGLRDIPLPQITTVPVAIKLIGFGNLRAEGKPKVISEPTSYLSLPSLLASVLTRDPLEVDGPWLEALLADIPKTDFVSENEGIRILKIQEEYYLYGKEKKWIKLSPDLVN